MRDAAATRLRLLSSATAEFAAHGIAGARVDRIVVAARSNKSQMYEYFGNKDALFDAVLANNFSLIVDAVPLDAEDLPGYAASLYDAYLRHPHIVRLSTWARLERHAVGDLFHDGIDHNAVKVAAVAEAQACGTVRGDSTAVDVLSLVTAMSMAWSPASVLIAASAGEAEELHGRRRTALARSVQLAFVTSTPDHWDDKADSRPV
jgi:AcrR family transcriptional regulator